MSVNTETSSLEKQISDYNEDGTVVGQAAADLVGFFGVTPVVQQSVGTLIATTGAVFASSGVWGFTSSTQANALRTAVGAIQTALKNLGLSD